MNEGRAFFNGQAGLAADPIGISLVLILDPRCWR